MMALFLISMCWQNCEDSDCSRLSIITLEPGDNATTLQPTQELLEISRASILWPAVPHWLLPG